MKILTIVVIILIFFCGNSISPNINSNIDYESYLEKFEQLDFDKAFIQIEKYEGGYGNDKNDPGGETYCGISRRSHSRWSGWKFIDSHKPIRYNQVFDTLKNDVYSFYKERYWSKLNIDKVKNQKLSEELFDVSVNMGSGNAIKFLKRSLNRMNYRIKVDYVLDSCTLKILHDKRRDTVFMNILTNSINQQQKFRYLEIVRNNPSRKIYLKSWLRRC